MDVHGWVRNLHEYAFVCHADLTHGLSRKLQPIDEMFLILYHLTCNVLEKNFRDQFNIDSSTISQILTTWINLLYFVLKQLPR